MSNAKVKGQTGVLSLTHGVGENSDRLIREAYLPMSSKTPAAIGFGMSMMSSAHLQSAVDDLRASGVRRVILIDEGTTCNASLLMLPSVLATTIGAPLMGRLLNVLGSRVIVQMGLALVAVGAPLRYIVLNEALPAGRGTAQGLLTVFLAVGQLSGAALIGGVAASQGGGTPGYRAGYSDLAAEPLHQPVASGKNQGCEHRAVADQQGGQLALLGDHQQRR